MLDFLEADWDVCVKQNQRDKEGHDAVLQQSLLWQYVAGDGQTITRTTRRRIAKAIFAIASPESLRDYSEIWENEVKEPEEQPNKKQKLGNVNFETGEVADYDSDEEMEDSSAPARMTRAIKGQFEVTTPLDLSVMDSGELDLTDAIERLGGSDAIALRQRLLAVVSAARDCV